MLSSWCCTCKLIVQVKMATSENCRSLCGVVHLTEAQTRLLRERIEQGYHVHLYVEIYRPSSRVVAGRNCRLLSLTYFTGWFCTVFLSHINSLVWICLLYKMLFWRCALQRVTDRMWSHVTFWLISQQIIQKVATYTKWPLFYKKKEWTPEVEEPKFCFKSM